MPCAPQGSAKQGEKVSWSEAAPRRYGLCGQACSYSFIVNAGYCRGFTTSLFKCMFSRRLCTDALRLGNSSTVTSSTSSTTWSLGRLRTTRFADACAQSVIWGMCLFVLPVMQPWHLSIETEDDIYFSDSDILRGLAVNSRINKIKGTMPPTRDDRKKSPKSKHNCHKLMKERR